MVHFRLPKLEVEGAKGRAESLENEDLLPVPLAQRTWGFVTFTVFWFSAVGTVANWLGGGTALSYGLNVWEAIGCSFGGNIVVGILMAINGRAGSVYHIPFPVYCRSSFGVFGAAWPVLNRSLSACVWNGINTVTGGQCIYILLHTFTPKIATLHNTMPSNSALTSAQMIGFFVFWALTALCLVVSVPKWRILIHVKLGAYVISTVGMLALALHRSGGLGNTLNTSLTTVSGSAHSWLLVRFFFLATASCATFVSNASDWQRNATKPRDPILGQIFGFPVSNFITTLFGCLTASSSEKLYGEVIWNPLTYLDRILTDNYDATHRAGVFFIAAGFTYSALFSCVFENVLPGGNDIMSLAPKWLNMKRAFAICMIITVVINPWYLLGSASIFVSFVSSYQIFLFSIAGICFTDYYFLSRGRLNLPYLYSTDREGPYWFTYGINWRALLAYCVGAGINFAGFLDNMGVKTLSTSVKHSFYFAWITTAVSASVVYYVTSMIFPTQTYKANKSTRFREWTQDEVEQFVIEKRASMPAHEVPAPEPESTRDSDADEKDVEGKETVNIAVLPV